MSQPSSNHVNVYALFKQVNRGGMSKYMGSTPSRYQRNKVATAKEWRKSCNLGEATLGGMWRPRLNLHSEFRLGRSIMRSVGRVMCP